MKIISKKHFFLKKLKKKCLSEKIRLLQRVEYFKIVLLSRPCLLSKPWDGYLEWQEYCLAFDVILILKRGNSDVQRFVFENGPQQKVSKCFREGLLSLFGHAHRYLAVLDFYRPNQRKDHGVEIQGNRYTPTLYVG